MILLLVKLVVTPILIAATTLVGRRFGPTAGGILATLPIVTGSVSFYVAVEQGTGFGSRTADAALVGIASVGWFGLAYARTSLRRGWPASLLAGYVAFVATSVAVPLLAAAPGWLAFGIVATSLLVATRLMPPVSAMEPAAAPRWDLPARMLTGALVVLLVTALAEQAGPQVSGLLSAAPFILAVLIVFTHANEGAGAAAAMARGFTIGLIGTAAFLALVVDLIGPAGIGIAYAVAAAGCLTLQASFMLGLRRGPLRGGSRVPARAGVASRAEPSDSERLPI